MSLPSVQIDDQSLSGPSDGQFKELSEKLVGDLFFSKSSEHLAIRKIYATDASIYQELPRAVLIPRNTQDIQCAVAFADQYAIPLIPRAAGTSLAGQVVGNGIVVDISPYFNEILELNIAEKWVRVQPGVIRDDLNKFLKPFGLQFGPETSTANRAMIGGMIGNNSCGLHSLVWGSTRDHLLEVETVMHDGQLYRFAAISKDEWERACRHPGPLGNVYGTIKAIVGDPERARWIRSRFPDPSVKRRNSGYALDALLDYTQQHEGGINLCQLLAGSEGTLCILTEAKLALMDCPPRQVTMVAVHCHSIRDALLANQHAVKYECAASELIDDMILNYARSSPRYAAHAALVVDDPKAILLVEFFSDTRDQGHEKANRLIHALQQENIGYAYPLLENEETHAAWDLRKAGLGLIRNLPGDAQPINLIEDGAVSAVNLPSYIEDVTRLLDTYGIRFCIYAHAGPGELHVEPILNVKTASGRALMRTIAKETAALLKKYRGSLSGEHGDGRLRGEFIPYMMGEEVYSLFRMIKDAFDPKGIFNRSKILDTPPMDTMLRYEPDAIPSSFPTYFDFTGEESMLRLTEKCSGSGDCRRSAMSGGLMCPSYMATRAEKDTTRARANILRQFITNAGWDNKREADEVMGILDLCLSCKGCKTECPSNVDVSKLKAEFTQQYYDRFGSPIRARTIAGFTQWMQYAYPARGLINLIARNSRLQGWMNRMMGFHPKRSLPKITNKKLTFRWDALRRSVPKQKNVNGKVHFLVDEFTEYTDADIAEKAIRFMLKAGYEVILHGMTESGRAYLSKGFVRKASSLAEKNVRLFSSLAHAQAPLVGLEPSALLSFRDEYPSLVTPGLRNTAQDLAGFSYTFEEWVYREMKAGRISSSLFHDQPAHILLHEHCHQKALGEKNVTQQILSLPLNYRVETIPSGCCGMAGSFGYEKEHFDLSMQIGELVLFPHVRTNDKKSMIAASGTSCRHQIHDGTGVKAKHPAEILYEALKA